LKLCVPPGFSRTIPASRLLLLLGASIDLLSRLDERLLALLALGRRQRCEMAFEDRIDRLHGLIELALHDSIITLRLSGYSSTGNENSGQMSTGSLEAGCIASANSGGILS
jgi:hypothetical protein